jgi:hypothetical protein
MNVQELESTAATLGAHVLYGDLSPGQAAAVKKGETWYIVMSDDRGCESCLALTLAHELAHIMLGHKGKGWNAQVDQEEDEAWCWAWRLIDD